MAKAQLLKMVREAYSEQNEMSLKASLAGITPQEATFVPAAGIKTIQELVLHIADYKVLYCSQGFGTHDIQVSGPGIDCAIEYLDKAQRLLESCLESLPQEALNKPIKTRFHGESAAHFFRTMAIHDIWHGGQIRTRRTLFATLRIPAAVSA